MWFGGVLAILYSGGSLAVTEEDCNAFSVACSVSSDDGSSHTIGCIESRSQQCMKYSDIPTSAISQRAVYIGDGCSAPAPVQSGRLIAAVARRGNCSFSVKMENAEKGGYSSLLIIGDSFRTKCERAPWIITNILCSDNQDGELQPPGINPQLFDRKLPVVMVSKKEAQKLLLLEGAEKQTAHLSIVVAKETVVTDVPFTLTLDVPNRGAVTLHIRDLEDPREEVHLFVETHKFQERLYELTYFAIRKILENRKALPREGAWGKLPSCDHNARAYLEILKRALCGLLGKDRSFDDKGREHAFNLENRLAGSEWPTLAHTMVGKVALDNVQQLLEHVEAHDIPGHFIETGIWRGGTCIFARGVMRALGIENRLVYAADSFEGLPKGDGILDPLDDRHHTFPHHKVSVKAVKENFDTYQLLDDRTKFVKGWFQDTLAYVDAERFAIIRLDGDMYASTMVALDALYDKLSDGGFVIVDDYLIPSCMEAILDFRAKRGIRDPLWALPGSTKNGVLKVFWQKGHSESGVRGKA